MSSFSGFILIDKPSGPTSHDIVVWARRKLHERRIGHCGTLDPMASGLLILAVGDALKAQDAVMAEQKTYRGRFRLGVLTDTDDTTGKALEIKDPSAITFEQIVSCSKQFLGVQIQRVPRFSAVKYQGRKLYEWARDGVNVSLPARSVDIKRFQAISYSCPDVMFEVVCSKGTYVRALARDMGEKLGVGATLSALTREAIGSLRREDAYSWMPNPINDTEFKKAFIPLAAWRPAEGKKPSARLAAHP